MLQESRSISADVASTIVAEWPSPYLLYKVRILIFYLPHMLTIMGDVNSVAPPFMACSSSNMLYRYNYQLIMLSMVLLWDRSSLGLPVHGSVTHTWVSAVWILMLTYNWLHIFLCKTQSTVSLWSVSFDLSNASCPWCCSVSVPRERALCLHTHPALVAFHFHSECYAYNWIELNWMANILHCFTCLTSSCTPIV